MEGKTSHKNATEPFGIQHVKRIRVGICWLHRAAADTHYHAMKAHACASQTFLGSRALLTEVRMPGLKCLVSSGRAGAITGDCIAQCVSPWKFGGLGLAADMFKSSIFKLFYRLFIFGAIYLTLIHPSFHIFDGDDEEPSWEYL